MKEIDRIKRINSVLEKGLNKLIKDLGPISIGKMLCTPYFMDT